MAIVYTGGLIGGNFGHSVVPLLSPRELTFPFPLSRELNRAGSGAKEVINKWRTKISFWSAIRRFGRAQTYVMNVVS
jgi:hypothetical protein